MMRRLGKLGYTHQYATGYNAPDPTAVLPGVHLVASQLKRWLTGTLHNAVADHQLPYYLDEYTFRFNRRQRRQGVSGLLLGAHRLSSPERGLWRCRLGSIGAPLWESLSRSLAPSPSADAGVDVHDGIGDPARAHAHQQRRTSYARVG
jgi:hypothetical protein